MLPAVPQPLPRRRLEGVLGTQRVTGGEGHVGAHGEGHEPLASGDHQVMLVVLRREGGERVAAVLLHGPRDVERRRLLPAAQDHRAQHEGEQVEAGRPAGDLQRAQEAGGVLGRRLDPGVEDQQARAHGLHGRGAAIVPGELVPQVGEAHRAEHPHRHRQHGRHHQRLADRGGIGAGGEAATEHGEIREEERGHQRVVQVERASHVREERDGEGDDGHPPREGLAPAEVARDLEERDPGEEHEGPAALGHLEGEPLLEVPHHRGLTGPDGREQVQHAHEADHEGHDRVEVGPPQLAPADGSSRVAQAQEHGDPGHEQERHGFLVAPHALEQRPERSPDGVAEGGHRHRPQEPGREVEEREGHDPHAEGAARGGDGDAEAVGEPAGEEQQAAPAADEIDDPLVAGVSTEAPLQPLAAAQPGELEPGLVGEGVRRDRHCDHDGKAEYAALGEEGGGQQHRLALERDAEEEERVAVLEEQRFHAPSASWRRARGRGGPTPPRPPATLLDYLVAECLATTLALNSL